MKKLLFASLFILGAGWASARAHAQVLVIANPSIKAGDVAKSDLKDIFTGAASTLDGSHAVPVLLKQCAVGDEFLSEYIGKNDTSFRASWRSLVFSGQTSMPKSMDTEAAMVDYVAHTPGAIGYIGKATPHEGTKVLAVK